MNVPTIMHLRANVRSKYLNLHLVICTTTPTENQCTMVASAVFITDLQGKAIISRNYRGDYPINKAIEVFANYLNEVEEEARKPIFHVDTNGDFESGDGVGMTGPGGQTYVYVVVSTVPT